MSEGDAERRCGHTVCLKCAEYIVLVADESLLMASPLGDAMALSTMRTRRALSASCSRYMVSLFLLENNLLR